MGRVRASLRFAAFRLDGTLLPLGRPKFADELKESDVDLLYEDLARGLHNKKIDAQWY